MLLKNQNKRLKQQTRFSNIFFFVKDFLFCKNIKLKYILFLSNWLNFILLNNILKTIFALTNQFKYQGYTFIGFCIKI